MAETTQRRKAREQAHRRRQIVDAAREMAEADGWDRVTTRRLADAIEYSQPVLYGHFSGGKPDIIQAVALQGFEELTTAMAGTAGGFAERMTEVATVYLDFASEHPAVYEAMFSMPIKAQFARTESEPELQAAFALIVAVLHQRTTSFPDLETTAEVLWSALHGLAALERADRLRPTARSSRIAIVVDLFVGQPT